jgi:hypothetical protein
MSSKRCDTCEFWEVDPHEVQRQQEWHADDRTGTCHRNAPRPTTGEHEYYVRMALVLVAPENDELDQHWEQAAEETSIWPGTHARDWCGEWNQK